MNYEANTCQWRVGDIVIHDGDAKEPKMLMRVTGELEDGRCTTRYLHPGQPRKFYENDIAELHDPAQFGISTLLLPEAFNPQHLEDWQYEWELVRLWNRRHPIGTAVTIQQSNGVAQTKTTGEAYLSGRSAYVYLENMGLYPLRYVQPYVVEADK
jgi:hypothetical protein